MCKKSKIRCGGLIYLASFVLVLGLAAGVANADITSGLVGYYPLDEGTGNTAYDMSGNGHNGTLPDSGVTWIPSGVINGGINIDGTAGSHIKLGTWNPAEGTGQLSLALWINWAQSGNVNQGLINKRDDWSDGGMMFGLRLLNDVNSLWFLRAPNTYVRAGSDVMTPFIGEWAHVAVTFDGTTARIYLNGEEIMSGGFSLANGTTAEVRIGSYISGSESFNGDMDEVRIYNRALTEAEIQQVMIGRPPEMAFGPSPANKATDVQREVVLSWGPGEFAAPTNGHKVYFGEDFNDVNDGIGGIIQDANSYTPPQLLDFGKTYYWRVDEVSAPPDSTIFEGEVWQFTVEPIANPIDGNNITATASSTSQEGMGPENTINNSGLDVNDMHSTEPTDMWFSSLGSDEPNGAWIEYELNKVYKLHEMWVWNSNSIFELSLAAIGFKDVSIEYLVDGTDYTTLGTTHEFARASGVDNCANTTVDLNGVAAKYVRLTANSNWGGFMPQYSLSEVRFLYIPVRARKPYPDSEATDVDLDVVLGFRAGREAAKHDVYFSIDEQAVIDGNAPVNTVPEASYDPFISLDLGTTYYWRVDEVNEDKTPTTWQGDIWSFSTQEYLVVDDFESYNDIPEGQEGSNLVYITWEDGYLNPATNGSTIGYVEAYQPSMEMDIVHGGKQSVPLMYDNSVAAYSEAKRTFAVPQDWTKAGIQTLALWFHGTAGNTGQLYVEVNGTKVLYDGNATNLALMSWQLWNIDLASSGVDLLDLQSVTTLTIGIGDNGASGTLYFDDIRLYALAPAPPNEWRIADEDDDVEEDVGPGSIDMTSGDLELPYENTGQADPQIIGLRFTEIPIPMGATITEAWVRFQVDETRGGTEAVNLIIEGELSLDVRSQRQRPRPHRAM